MPHARLLVTGGAGFIGSHLVERLLAEGSEVTVIDDCSTGRRTNLESSLSNPNLTFIHSRISDCLELPEIVRRTDGIYHLAAAVGVDLVVRSPLHVIQTNVIETNHILSAAATVRVPVLIASTSEVYGNTDAEHHSEEDDLRIGRSHIGRWSYSCSKLMTEFSAMAHALEYNLPVTIARLFNTVGPRQTGQYGMVLPRFLCAALRGEPLRVHGDGNQRRTFSAVEDTVEALIRLQRTQAARGEVFNVGSTEDISILELAKMITRKLNSTSTIEFVPYHQLFDRPFEDFRSHKPLVDKLFGVTGFKPSTPLSSIIDRLALAA